ncbi:MAG: PQQ-binding-like beta-propeller repeat protein [Acidobacteriota bacterium]
MNWIFACLLSLTLSAQDNWPGWRGNGDSRSDARNLPLEWSDSKNLAWSANLPGYGQSSPVVWRDKVFVTSVAGENKEKLLITSIDLKSGRLLWTREYASTFPHKDLGIRSRAAPTPAVDRHRLYVFFESGDLFAFDHQGKLQWRRELAREYGDFKNVHGLGSSIALTERGIVTMISDRGPSYMLSIDKATGKNIWKTDLPEGGSWATPAVINHQGRAQIVISISGRVASYDAASGKEIWVVNRKKGDVVSSPSVSDSLVVIGSSVKGSTFAVRLGGEGDITDKQIAWRAASATGYYASPLIHQGRVYLVNRVGVIYCVDLQTGAELWNTRIEGECWASPMAVGDRIYFFTIDGNSKVLRAGEKPEVLAENRLSIEGRIYGVASVDGALLVRTGRRLIRLSEEAKRR